MSEGKYTGCFPRLSWAWPSQERTLLLLAALAPDAERALEALDTWLRATPLDDATFADHRLLAAVSSRHGSALASFGEYHRLLGIQRFNWTKSRMVIKECLPPLRAMADSGIRVVLIKGAGRVARDPSAQKARTSYDLDILLSDSDFSRGFEILAGLGWESSRGESTLGLRGRISTVRARNFKMGRFGDIDLHRNAYKAVNASVSDDLLLIDEAQPVSFHGIDCFIPSPEERLSIAFAHGGSDSDHHSDWLVDATHILSEEDIDWQKMTGILKRRRLTGQANIAFSFLGEAIGLRKLDGAAAQGLATRDRRSKPSEYGALLMARPSSQSGSAVRSVRSVVQHVRKLRSSGRDLKSDTPRSLGLLSRAKPHALMPVPSLSAAVEAPSEVGGSFRLTLEVLLFPEFPRRRIELELNSNTRCICSFRGLAPKKLTGPARVSFKADVQLEDADGPLSLNALPLHHVQTGAPRSEVERAAAVPFVVKKVQLARKGR